MKTIVLSIIMVMCLVNIAFPECKDYEFIKLNNMTEQQFITAYEENLTEKNRINKEFLDKEVNSNLSSDVRKKMNDCNNYNDKIMRSFKNKFPGKNLRKPPANRY